MGFHQPVSEVKGSAAHQAEKGGYQKGHVNVGLDKYQVAQHGTKYQRQIGESGMNANKNNPVIFGSGFQQGCQDHRNGTGCKKAGYYTG